MLLTWGSSYSVTNFLACSRSAAASFLMTRKSLSFGYSVLGWGPRSEKEFVNLNLPKPAYHLSETLYYFMNKLFYYECYDDMMSKLITNYLRTSEGTFVLVFVHKFVRSC